MIPIAAAARASLFSGSCRPLRRTTSAVLCVKPLQSHHGRPATVRCFSASSSTKSNMVPVDHLRNLAFVAHVDHGKTTLVDALFRATLTESQKARLEERAMDSGDLEKERGITILSKVTGLQVEDADGQPVTMNLLDTPGHADFGGEVERIMSMVDMVCLLVDATEGPMPQTKFVLSKALNRGLKPIVIMNKVDRDTAVPNEVEDKIFDLFIELGANDEQMDYETVYASGKEGWAIRSLEDSRECGMQPLLDAILENCPKPLVKDPSIHPDFSMLVSIIESDKSIHQGDVLFTGRVETGRIQPGESVKVLNMEGEITETGKIQKILGRSGLNRIELDQAVAGNIVTLVGLANAQVSDTICNPKITSPLEALPVDAPTLTIRIGPNTSPLAGKEGTKLLARQIQDRLAEEARSNVAVTVNKVSGSDMVEVGGRGELQLAVLVETMRREGFEMSVASPQVVLKAGENGENLEPVEDVFIEVGDDLTGSVIEKMAAVEGTMVDMRNLSGGRTQLEFTVPSRGLFGMRAKIMKESGGTAVMYSTFREYAKMKTIKKKTRGTMVSMAQGTATVYALEALEARGVLYVSPHDEVYNGQVIGESAKADEDLECNPTKAKQLTNFRAAGKDDFVRLAVAQPPALEESIGYIQEDELIEVTPGTIRIRKKQLDPKERARERRQRQQQKQ